MKGGGETRGEGVDVRRSCTECPKRMVPIKVASSQAGIETPRTAARKRKREEKRKAKLLGVYSGLPAKAAGWAGAQAQQWRALGKREHAAQCESERGTKGSQGNQLRGCQVPTSARYQQNSR